MAGTIGVAKEALEAATKLLAPDLLIVAMADLENMFCDGINTMEVEKNGYTTCLLRTPRFCNECLLFFNFFFLFFTFFLRTFPIYLLNLVGNILLRGDPVWRTPRIGVREWVVCRTYVIRMISRSVLTSERR